MTKHVVSLARHAITCPYNLMAVCSPAYECFLVFVTALWAGHDLLSTKPVDKEDSVKTVSR